MNVKMSDIMRLPIFNNQISLIAGHNGLDKKLNQVAVMEVPDFHTGTYEPGLFLLSTLYYFKDDPSLMIQAFSTMADKGISGILLKLNRFITEVPPELVQIAEEKRIPCL
jgi:purine catabolism regulator